MGGTALKLMALLTAKTEKSKTDDNKTVPCSDYQNKGQKKNIHRPGMTQTGRSCINESLVDD